MWQPIKDTSKIPVDSDLRLAVINSDGVHALVFPCRRKRTGWIHAETGREIEVFPTHWQYWSDDPAIVPGTRYN